MGARCPGVIRAGFIFTSAGDSWLGGASYYRNLFSALSGLPSRKIEPVIISSNLGADALGRQFPNLTVVQCSLLDLPPLAGKVRRAVQLVSGRDLPLERFLNSAGIEVLSHSGYLGKRARIPSIAWIPDFQELAFPEFFSKQELAARKRNAINCARHTSTLVFSSQAALNDFKTIKVDPVETEVLQFVTDLPPESDLLSLDELRLEYQIGEKFFHLPNQFWVHKNHRLVLEALALLRGQGRNMTVLATGNTSDHRQPGYFLSLTQTAKELGVSDLFRPLGIVPYPHLMSLMRHSVAVINASRFEGWSTTVEEGKSMGKTILLSDIPVHREQAPVRGLYFGPQDAQRLAEHMTDAWNAWDLVGEQAFFQEARQRAPERRRAFAERYQQIVLSTLARHKAASRS